MIGRRTLGRVYNAAIKLDADANVSEALHITSSVESGIAAMSAGLRPCGRCRRNALAEFPVLGGVEALTVIGGDARAVAEVASRWRDAGREVCARPP